MPLSGLCSRISLVREASIGESRACAVKRARRAVTTLEQGGVLNMNESAFHVFTVVLAARSPIILLQLSPCGVPSFSSICSVTARSATTATPKARVTRLGLLLFSAILACALLNSVAAIGPEAGVRPGSASVAATAAATVSTPLPTTPQLDRQLQAERQHRVKEQRSASMPQAQRRVKDPQHGEGDARTRVLGVLVLLVMVPLVVVVETVRSM